MLKTGILLGSFFSLTTVIIGAFGAHALKEHLNAYGTSIYQQAVIYQMFHSLAILVVTIINHNLDTIDLSISLWFFSLGIVFFSGSLYILAITQAKWLGAVTPIGGLLFILGWFWIIFKTFNLNI